MQLELYVENHLEQEPEQSLVDMWRRAAEIALAEKTVLADRLCELNLMLCDNEEIRQYNAEYRSVDKATDVLSFPLIDDWDELCSVPLEIPVMIGDLIISVPKAHEQSEEYGHSFEREAVFLFVHGVLHCLGYDHIEEADELKMRAKQREILEKLDLAL